MDLLITMAEVEATNVWNSQTWIINNAFFNNRLLDGNSPDLITCEYVKKSFVKYTPADPLVLNYIFHESIIYIDSKISVTLIKETTSQMMEKIF